MRFKSVLFPTTAALVTSSFGCHKNNKEPAYIETLQWLEKADAVADAKQALSSGDHRLLAVCDVGISISGAGSKDFAFLQQKYGIYLIPGTTGGLEHPEHVRLVQMAHKYSGIYNQYIIREYKPEARP